MKKTKMHEICSNMIKQWLFSVVSFVSRIDLSEKEAKEEIWKKKVNGDQVHEEIGCDCQMAIPHF